MWGAYHRAGGDIEKCVRNLGDCARYVAQSADSVEKMGEALEAWGLLKSADPYSQEAQQGMEWCRLSLARAAERSSDFVAARATGMHSWSFPRTTIARLTGSGG